MKHLELHILQSFPVACLNRDDLNSPKTAIFGGVQRARVSSQSWKRAIREYAKQISPSCFQGQRTRLIIEPLRAALIEQGVPEANALEEAKKLAGEISDLDQKAEKKGKQQIKTLFFTTPAELKTLAHAFKTSGDLKKALKAVGADILKDAADIALFGRMVANDHSLTIEGAAMFAHALSTHKADNEIDFFSAVDDRQPKEEPGAAMTSTLEFNSATYYRFAALNLDMLKDKDHLAVLSTEERIKIVRAFIEAVLLAIPGARRNSMNAATLPGYALGIIRESGHPVQLVNAFEKPIPRRSAGFFDASLDSLKNEYESVNKIWGLKDRELESITIPEVALSEFLDRMTSHVD